jgi:hypothetical protein
VQMKAKGNDVRVTVGMNKDGTATISPAAAAKLRAAGIPLIANYIHDKTFVIRGTLNGQAVNQVLSGSHNATWGANYENDELLDVLPDNVAIATAYHTHFMNLFLSGRRVLG